MRGWGIAAVVMAAAAPGCTKKNTELMIVVQTDVRVPKDLDSVRISVQSYGAVQFEQDYPVGPTGVHLPASIGVVSSHDGSGPVDVIITGYFKSTARVLRKARLGFAKGRTALVRMPLRFSCYDKLDCGEGLSCVAGQCQSVDVDVEQLPEFSEATAIGDPSPQPGDPFDGCFAPIACFREAIALTPSGDGCTFDTYLLHGISPTVALRGAPGGLGFCDDTGCVIPVDFDLAEGWSWVDSRQQAIRLAPGLCELARKRSLGVEATVLCGTKTTERVYCDEGSNPIGDGGGDVSFDDVGPDARDDAVAVDDTSIADAGFDSTTTDTALPASSHIDFSIDGLHQHIDCTMLDRDFAVKPTGGSPVLLGGTSASTKLTFLILAPSTLAPYAAGTVDGVYSLFDGTRSGGAPMLAFQLDYPVGSATYDSLTGAPSATVFHKVTTKLESTTATTVSYRISGTFQGKFSKRDSSDAGVGTFDGSGTWSLLLTFPRPADAGVDASTD